LPVPQRHFQSGGISGWNTVSDCFGHRPARAGVRHPSARSPVPGQLSRHGASLNWKIVGSVPSTLKVSTDGGSTLPPENVFAGVQRQRAAEGGFSDRAASAPVDPAPDAAC
jgi:hypothetical protein